MTQLILYAVEEKNDIIFSLNKLMNLNDIFGHVHLLISANTPLFTVFYTMLGFFYYRITSGRAIDLKLFFLQQSNHEEKRLKLACRGSMKICSYGWLVQLESIQIWEV